MALSRHVLFAKPLEDFGEHLNEVLAPSRAIKTPEHLQGRESQLRDVRQALAMKGRHVFIHGFRGVGKTSLAFTAANVVQSSDAAPIYVQCEPDTPFLKLAHDILKKLLPTDPREVKRTIEANGGGSAGPAWLKLTAGMRQVIEQGQIPLPSSINEAIQLLAFASCQHSKKPVVIIDEFDHLDAAQHVNVDLFIKQLAEEDHQPVKMIFCGVGESLNSLFNAHLSTYRYFHAIKLEQLALDHSRAIVLKAAAELDIIFDDTTSWRIARISDGFPHFVHLMCEKVLWEMYNDTDRSWLATGNVGLNHYRNGTQAAVEAALEELRKDYEGAVRKYSADAELILWSAADGHELLRKLGDIFKSYERIRDHNGNLKQLDENQFKGRVYNLAKESHGQILRGNKKGWYEFDKKMMRGYARLTAEAKGVELFPDHPMIRKGITLELSSKFVAV